MDLILFGIQGSGKGTQATLLAKKYQLIIFETGAELRKMAKLESNLAQKVKNIIESGHLVPNKIVMEIVSQFLTNANSAQQLLFDGIPRKKIQAQSFDKLMKLSKREFMGIYIDLSEQEALKRLENRRICSQCKTVYSLYSQKDRCPKCNHKLIKRNDDNPDSIKARFKAFREETLPVIKNYQKHQKIIVINGDKEIPLVFENIMQKIGHYFK